MKVGHSNVCKVVTRLVTLMCVRLEPSGSLLCAQTYDETRHSTVGPPILLKKKLNFRKLAKCNSESYSVLCNWIQFTSSDCNCCADF